MTPEQIVNEIFFGMGSMVSNGCNPTHVMIHPKTISELMDYYSTTRDCECYRLNKLLGLYVIEDPSIEPGHARLIDLSEMIKWMRDVNKYSVVDTPI